MTPCGPASGIQPDRALLRRIFDDRAAGSSAFSPVELQDLVASAQVMDPVEHHALLAAVTPDGARPSATTGCGYTCPGTCVMPRDASCSR